MPSYLKTGFIYLTVPICFSSLYAQKDVLGANKAGFSISTNDEAHVKNIYLNSRRIGRLPTLAVSFRKRVIINGVIFARFTTITPLRTI